VGRVRYRSEVRRVRYYGLHTVCHLGGRGRSGAACGNAGARSGWGIQRERWQRARTGALPCEA